MEFKTDAIVLKLIDFGESDKLATFLTADRGKVTARFRGVRKSGAKMKGAAQPFAFAEYVFAERSGRVTVISASVHNSFYSLTDSVSMYYAASSVVETCDKLTAEGSGDARLLVAAVTALEGIAQGESGFALLTFLIKALSISGYSVRAEKCPITGGELTGRMYFDMDGGVFCSKLKGKGARASESTYHAVRAALGEDDEYTQDGVKRALRLMGAYLNYKTEESIASLEQYTFIIGE